MWMNLPFTLRLNGEGQMMKSKNGGIGGIDFRVVVGQQCTWWGAIQDAAYTKDNIPICPVCGGAMSQLATSAHFWQAVDWFEKGEHGVKEPHPGYRSFQEWLRHRCFNDILVAIATYEASTGITITLSREDYE